MGFGLPAAIGAALETGGRVCCITGDGSLSINIQELATLAELAQLLSCSARVLNELFQGPLHAHVRFVRCKPGPWRYSVTDARTAIEPYREEIETRRARALALEASNRAAKAAKIAASQVAPKAADEVLVKTNTPGRPGSTRPPPAKSASSRPRAPEVVFVTRSSAPRKPESAKT
jgi:hypothetical protein